MALDDVARVRCLRNRTAAFEKRNEVHKSLQRIFEITFYCGHTICRTCALIMACPTGLAQPNRARIQILSCPVCRQDGHFNPQHVQRNYACLPGYVRPRPNN
ncbi:hypothetical protein CAEBREN_25755 [Caenorhabditis brenneri]|uniref:RING-type domain-containing protein n=1 Tax=Caenorhabditis brenneri TaxID=135651 RepID=G0NU88_CAEBE|nr:hypothetical protein CAEBREN_25755 [Caenorhabditis brenneri]